MNLLAKIRHSPLKSYNRFGRGFFLGLIIHYVVTLITLNRNNKCTEWLAPFGVNSMAGKVYDKEAGESFNAVTKDDKLDFLVSGDTPYLYDSKE